ncbi:MAG: Hsp20/alpha crystallin family protein [Candidatus Omnitrophica bacterium]|nr:Hsp20/alpha crystallin family protein [Candidatus Omnitrophota bacterium]
MSLIRWKPKQTKLYDDFFGFDHPFFGTSLFPSLKEYDINQGAAWYPALDVSEDKENVYVKADLPGLEKKDISVDIKNQTLVIRGERKSEDEKKEKNYYHIERSYGVFERRLNLSSQIDTKKIKATYNNGVLELVLPKSAESKEQTISIE